MSCSSQFYLRTYLYPRYIKKYLISYNRLFDTGLTRKSRMRMVCFRAAVGKNSLKGLRKDSGNCIGYKMNMEEYL